MRPLKNVTVLDISRLLPGGYASLLLREEGARVIKLEEPALGDYFRALTGDAFSVFKAHTDVIHQSKESLALNLKTAEGKIVFKKLVRLTDVVIESFRPGTLKRLGLDYKVLKKINPRVILCSITGFGQKNAEGHLAAHDVNFLGLSGLASQMKDKNGIPILPGFQMIDLATGMEAAFKISAALSKPKKDRGAWIDVSMRGAALSFSRFSDFSETPNILAGALVRYGIYETSDGRYMTLGALEGKFWKKFCQIVDHPEWAVRADSFEPLGESVREEVKRIFKKKTFREWTEIGLREDFCLFPVEENLDKSHWTGKSPALGAETQKILKSLGYSPQKIRSLKEEGTIA